jgi:UDP-N-acetyl-D-mannosaminuronic acid dehydrogenase
MTEGKHFYGNVLKIPLHQVSSPDVAELTKVVENSYRYLEIAFAEEIKMVCDNTSLDFDELRDAINTKWNIKILDARDGIGGHCLPKDSQMFLDFSRNSVVTSMIRAAKMVDSQYRFHLIQKATQEIPLARG